MERRGEGVSRTFLTRTGYFGRLISRKKQRARFSCDLGGSYRIKLFPSTIYVSLNAIFWEAHKDERFVGTFLRVDTDFFLLETSLFGGYIDSSIFITHVFRRVQH